MNKFKLVSNFDVVPAQKEAIEELLQSIKKGNKYQTLLGVTGCGKTFVMANIIEQINKPALVIAHNKSLAAQLYNEFKMFFPNNAVEYFISYYDYYQPEAYVPSTDTYIEKDTSINDEIERLRLKATSSLMERRDVIIIASVSCIYGLGSPEDYKKSTFFIQTGKEYPRRKLLQKLINMYYDRNDTAPQRGTFRVRGDSIEIYPAYEKWGLRLNFWGDELEEIEFIDPLTGKAFETVSSFILYPAKHFITSEERLSRAIKSIKEELQEVITKFKKENKLVEAQRIEQRTLYDIEMIQEVGYCTGIENYSRHLSGREPGSRPYTLIDFFPEDFITFIDESHVTIPQIRGMYAGDRSRKEVLVKYGFRLPSALDNRPMFFEEFEKSMNQVVFVSATPGPYELQKSGENIIELLIRPTGLIDPEIEIHPAKNQVDHFISIAREVTNKGERILATTLTKKMAEDLTTYLMEMGFKTQYLHSEIDALERVEILRNLRRGDFDILVGINLLREGLDLPEVSLVAIFDADKEGFLRSQTSLIQTMGRAARHINGKVILYADKITDSIKKVITEVNRRRKIQIEYNKKYNITPKSVKRSIDESLKIPDNFSEDALKELLKKKSSKLKTLNEIENTIEILKKQMNTFADNLEFEKAAIIRDEIKRLISLTKNKKI